MNKHPTEIKSNIKKKTELIVLLDVITIKDEKIAIIWLERSAQKAYPPALQQLAIMYYYGIGTVKNDVKAYAVSYTQLTLPTSDLV